MARMWKAWEAYEKAVVYADKNSHDIIKGQSQYARYMALHMEVESHAGAFAYLKTTYPD